LPKDFLKPIKRFAWYEAMNIFTHIDIRRHVILSGARRVGKTTLLYQMIEELLKNRVDAKKILYLSYDHPLLKFCAMDEIMSIFEANVSPEDETYLFFDEIQYAKDWEMWLKVFYNTKPGRRIVATGSASPVLTRGASESGVGRWSIIPVLTLSFYEYCEILGFEDRPQLERDIRPTGLASLKNTEISNLLHSIFRTRQPDLY